MKWVDSFQLFLFDFDGLLVDTEPLHYKAFMALIEKNGCQLDLTFPHYLKLAHANATDLRDFTFASLPALHQKKPNWEELRREKGTIYLELLKRERLNFLPGVEGLLTYLQKKEIKRAVVTNSPEDQVSAIKSHLPLLEAIPLWICREKCRSPKPDPEGYLLAIHALAKAGDRIVGFEDSFKGLQALEATPAKAVLITPRTDVPKGKTHFVSLSSIDHLH